MGILLTLPTQNIKCVMETTIFSLKNMMTEKVPKQWFLFTFFGSKRDVKWIFLTQFYFDVNK